MEVHFFCVHMSMIWVPENVFFLHMRLVSSIIDWWAFSLEFIRSWGFADGYSYCVYICVLKRRRRKSLFEFVVVFMGDQLELFLFVCLLVCFSLHFIVCQRLDLCSHQMNGKHDHYLEQYSWSTVLCIQLMLNLSYRNYHVSTAGFRTIWDNLLLT